MTDGAPQNFKISDAAKAKIVSLLDEMKKFNPSETWIAAVIWSTSRDSGGSVIGDGPGIGIYPKADITDDQSLKFGELTLFFPGADQSHFVDKTLEFDGASNRFRLISS